MEIWSENSFESPTTGDWLYDNKTIAAAAGDAIDKFAPINFTESKNQDLINTKDLIDTKASIDTKYEFSQASSTSQDEDNHHNNAESTNNQKGKTEIYLENKRLQIWIQMKGFWKERNLYIQKTQKLIQKPLSI